MLKHLAKNNKLVNLVHCVAVITLINGVSVNAQEAPSRLQWHDQYAETKRQHQTSSDKRIKAQQYFQALNQQAVSRLQRSATHQPLNSAVLKTIKTSKTGSTVANYQHKYAGYDIINRPFSLLMDTKDRLLVSSGQTPSPIARELDGKALEKYREAIIIAFHAITSTRNIAIDSMTQQQVIAHSNSSQWTLGKPPRIKQVYYDTGHALLPAAYIEMDITNTQNKQRVYRAFTIELNKLTILQQHSLSAHANEFSYRIYANQDGSPYQGPHGNILPVLTEPESELELLLSTPIIQAPLRSLSSYPQLSTSDPWLSPTATTTSGNNVIAFADIVSPNGLNDNDIIANTTSDFTFDYQLQDNQSPLSDNAVKAGVVNIFYLTNYLHDYFYDYGFDELAGNAQQDNYNRVPLDFSSDTDGDPTNNDPLLAQTQDYTGMNNASMYTPSDGTSPEMQMHLYQFSNVEITFPNNVDPLYQVQSSGFGDSEFANISGRLVRFEAGTSNNQNLACSVENQGNNLAGNIVLINRGECLFTEKVKLAQNAGAIAALIANNDSSTSEPSPMGGSDATVTLPNMGINYADGQRLYGLIDSVQGVTLSITSGLRDSAFDNGIIAHEWGHYITNRMIGDGSGLLNAQGGSLGEGWADFHSLLIIAEEQQASLPDNDKFQNGYAIGTHVEAFYAGIRRVRYSTDMTINPLRFRHISDNAGTDVGLRATSNASPHDAGEVWASVLWDSYVALINQHGFATGKHKMSSYLVSSYAITPLDPTYVEARDALLASAYASDENDYILMLAAFARRGLGLGAKAPDRYSTSLSGVIESELTELKAAELESHSITHDIDTGIYPSCDADGVLDINETASVTLTVNNIGNQTINGLTATISSQSDHNVSFENNGTIIFSSLPRLAMTSSQPLKFSLLAADANSELELIVSFSHVDPSVQVPEPFSISLTVNVDYLLDGNTATIQTDNMEDVTSKYNWQENLVTANQEITSLQSLVAPTFAMQSSNNQLGQSVMFLENPGFNADVSVQSQPFTLVDDAPFILSFWHAYDIEQDYDGAVVEIKINDGVWQDVTQAGGIFVTGYDSEIISNPVQPIAGRQAFTGANLFGGNEAISFGDSLQGQTIQLRFRMSSDEYLGNQGWWLDNIRLDGVASPVFFEAVDGSAVACEAPALNLAITEQNTVGFAGDSVTLNADIVSTEIALVTTQWQQTSGPNAVQWSADTTSLSFVLPNVSEQQTVTIILTGQLNGIEIQDTAEITVLPPLNVAIGAATNSNESSLTSLTASTNISDQPIVYQWTQTSGVEATLNNTAQATVSVTTPSVLQTEITEFTVTASLFGQIATASTTMTINNNLPLGLVVPTNITLTENTSTTLQATVTGDNGAAPINITWQPQSTNISVSSDNQTSTLLTANDVSENTTATLIVVLTNGTERVEKLITINVSDSGDSNSTSGVNTTDSSDAGNGSSGGGSFNLLVVLWLTGFAFLGRRKIIH